VKQKAEHWNEESCNEIGVENFDFSHLKVLTQKYVSTAERAEEINRSELE
jgi:hypothetical protein